MQPETSDAIVAAYADGVDIEQIEQRYGVTRAEIEQIVANRIAPQPPQTKPKGPGLDNTGNRIALGVGVGFVVQIFAGLLDGEFGVRMVVWAVVAVLVYALATMLRR